MNIPEEIIGLIVDALLSNATSLVEEVDSFDWNVPCGGIEFSTLRNMALVHRSWTNTARRGYWSRALLHGKRLKNAHLDHIRCSYLRELGVLVGDPIIVEDAALPVGQQLESIAYLLRHAPDIRLLYLDIDVRLFNGGHGLFLEQLRRQVNLERLWIGGIVDWHPSLILQALTGLTSLSELALEIEFDIFDVDGLDGDSDSNDNIASNKGVPDDLGLRPNKLTSIAILEPFLEYDSHQLCLDWLLRPRHDFYVKDLTLALNKAGQYEAIRDNGIAACLRECLMQLESLQIMCLVTNSADAKYVQEDTTNRLLASASSLHSFSLCCDKSLRTCRLDIPSTLRDVTIQLEFFPPKEIDELLGSHQLRSSFEETDKNIQSIVSSWGTQTSSSIDRITGKKLTIAIVSSSDPSLKADTGSFALALAFPLASQACTEAGISLWFEMCLSPTSFMKVSFG